MSITEQTVLIDQHGHEIDRSERKLYLLSELKALHDRPAPEQDDEIESGALSRALDWVSQGNSEFWDGRDEIENYLLPEHFGLAGITFNPKSVEFNVGYGGSWFVLPRDTDIDTDTFLRAMKAYFEGRDYRGKDYAKATQRTVAPTYRQHKIDLRSKDARIAREQGFVVHVVNSHWSRGGTDEFDLDYHYEDMSDTFKSDCNEFLAALCHDAASILNDEYEYETGDEEYLIEGADLNEYTFDRAGRRRG